MKRPNKYILPIVMLIGCLLIVPLYAESEKDIFDKARIALFDRKWDEALSGLNRLLTQYPNSGYKGQVLFYKGKCYEEKNAMQQAVDSYNAFLKISSNESLNEEASRAIIDMNYSLYRSTGNKKYLGEITNFLSNRQKVVKYFAAFKLSYVDDKTYASKSIPVLKQIVESDDDKDLVDRAKIALMRVNPSVLKEVAPSQSNENKLLSIRVFDKHSKSDSFSIKIPFMLARLALDSLSNKDKILLKKEGYDLNKIIETLVKTKELLRFESEDTVITIKLE